MKRFFFFLCFSLPVLCQLFGEIIETKKFQNITAYAEPNTLILLDIDDTLLIPTQTLGTDVWFMSRFEYHQARTTDRSLALDRALAEWEAVRHLTNVKIVEEGTQAIIDEMQKDNIVVMGLTTQGLALATRTVVQLKSLSIDLSKTAPSYLDHYYMNGRNGVLYRQGILFTSGTDKGEALIKFFDTTGYYPKRVVFINDKQAHLEDVEKSMVQKNIAFTGLRYSYSDPRVENFCEEIATLQWTRSTFDHLLSDEEAASLLNPAN
jgi:hypothetical protein